MVYVYTYPAQKRILCFHTKNRNVELAANPNYKEYTVPDDFNLDRVIKDENGNDFNLQFRSHSGSFFFFDMVRITSLFNPGGRVSDSISVTKPYL